MVYSINNKPVTAEEFEERLKVAIDEYIPYTKYWPKKEDIRKELSEKKRVRFHKYDKRYKDKLVIVSYEDFMACEEEILEMENIIAGNEYDACDGDSIQIALALWNAGYRKIKGGE